ncbi:PEP/pyruvate-binding domain-containing protein [Candidatus Babeliales bacterium]|nr:PEP/pyruvate-binding domain-containing protein [Candidatus Babeliales bacterium]
MNGRNKKLLLLVLIELVLSNTMFAAASSSSLSSVTVPAHSAFYSPGSSFVGWHNSAAVFMPSSSYASSSSSSSTISLPINHVNQRQLRNLAEIQGYGYKTANLMIMRDNLVEKINEMLANHPKFSGFVVHIPEFVGVPTTSVQSFLKKNGIDLLERWEELVDDLSLNARTQALANKTLPEDFLENAEKLANDIALLKPTTIELSKEVRKFLKEAKSKNWKLMFRSTGKEDNQEFSNAGGNESEANVEPTEEAFVKALLSVVASYVRPKSLQQRCEAGDKTIFDMPFIPLLVQRMIGEKEVIPTGCVVYTQEPEARLNGVSAMQCTFGHNAAVVDNKLPTDEYLVQGQNVFATIKIKHERLVPALEGLVEQANPEEIQKARALESFAAQAIGFVSQQIHEAYGMPMDLELAYEPDTKTIALVQARPIVYPGVKQVPSYLKDASAFLSEKKLSGTTVINAGNYVRSIQNKDQVLTASHLDGALAAYNSGAIDKQKVKVVVVSDPKAGPYSHAAAIFRGAGIAVMHTPALAKLESLLGAEDVALLVDVQRGLIVQAKEAELNEGFLNYPLPLQMSAIDADEAFVVLAQEYFPEKTNQDLIALLAEGHQEHAQQALASIVQRIHGALAEKQSLAECHNKQSACSEQRAAQRALEKLEVLQQKVRTAGSILNKHLSLPARDIRRLFPLRFLEALLFQEPTPGIVDVDSFESIAKNFDQEMSFVNNTVVPLVSAGSVDQGLLQDDNMFALAFYGARVALTPELENKWTVFVDQIRQSKNAEQIKNLSIMVEQLRSLKAFSAWLHLFFEPAVAQASTHEVFNNLFEMFEQSREFVETLQRKQNMLFQIKDSDWEEPSNVEGLFAYVQEHFFNYLMADDFVNIFALQDEAGRFKQVMALSFLDTFIDIFDNHFVKTFKGSTGKYHDTAEQVKMFKKIVAQYLAMMEKYLGLAAGKGHNFLKGLWIKGTYSFYMFCVKYRFGQCTDGADELLPSSRFDVGASLWGTFGMAETVIVVPSNLEDFFTLSHQNILWSFYVLMNGAGVDRAQKPLSVAVIENSLHEIARNFNPFRAREFTNTGVHFSDAGVRYAYQITLRVHGVTFTMDYDKAHNKIILEGNFVGHDRDWLRMEDFTVLFGLVNGISHQIEFQNRGELGVSFIFEVDQDNQKYVAQYVEKMILGTFPYGRTIVKDYIKDHSDEVAEVFMQAFAAGQQGIESGDRDVRDVSLSLFEKLAGRLDAVLETVSIKDTLVATIKIGLKNQDIRYDERQRLIELLERLEPSIL